MPYSSNSDLLKEISTAELAKLTGDPEGITIDTERTGYARANADGLIDAYLYGRYDVPFSDTPDPLIKRLSCDLTIVYLYEYAYHGSIVPNTILNRKLNAVSLLKDLQRGTIVLQDAVSGGNAPPSVITNKQDYERIFDEDTLDKFMDEQ